MPTLTNNTETAIELPFWGKKLIQPGESIYCAKYYPDIPAGLDITGHLPAPIETLHHAALPVSLSNLARYQYIEILNSSGSDIECVFNGDTAAEPLIVGDDLSQPIGLNGDIYSLEITGLGVGTVQVNAVKVSGRSEGPIQWQL